MNFRVTSFLFAVFVAISSSSGITGSGQEPASERNATAEEITGDWQALPIPDALQPKALKANPWPAPCQWYSYVSDGSLKSIDHTPAASSPCEIKSAKQLDETMKAVPAVATWTYDLSPVYKKGLIIVKRSDVQHYAEYWEPHIVTKTFTKGSEEFQEGDLILYLIDLHQPVHMVWIRHLRRLQ